MNRKKQIANWSIKLLALALVMFWVALPAQAMPTIFINEIHYDNTGADTGEAIEIAGPAGTNLNGWSIVLYNGSGGAVYDTDTLSGTIPDQQNGFGTVVINYPSNGLQNGSPDGIALVDASSAVVQFLSYEGSFVGVGGPANGLTSTNIGVAEAGSEPVGQSLQLTGTGTTYSDFTWSGPAASTFGAINTGQTFSGGPANAPVVATCGSPLAVIEGNSASRSVSGSDTDGTVTGVTLVNVNPPTSDITLADVTPASGAGGTATANLNVAATLAAGSYVATLEFSNNDATPQTAQCTLTVTVTDFVTIAEIQGTQQFSAYNGQTIATRGIVTLIHKNGSRFWLQDPIGDNDPATSEGIFVTDTGRAAGLTTPAVGDLVTVIARVEEQQFAPSLPLTRLRNLSAVIVESSGNPLPRAVELKNLPDEVITEGIAFWEPLEGMLVRVKNATVVAPTNDFGEFAMLARQDTRAGFGYYPQTGHILLKYYSNDGFVDYNPERIAVDDESLQTPLVVRPGDKIADFVGVVDYTFSMYKLQPVSATGVDNKPLPSVPVSKRSGKPGNLVVTSFNVENLFDLVDDPGKDDTSSTPTPAQLETKLAKLALAIQVELKLPDILIIEEVENTAILQQLGDRVNTAAGTNYKATSFDASDARGIEVGFLWDDNRVNLVNAFQLNDTIVPGVSAAFGPTSESPGREPLVGIFNVTGGVNDPTLTIIGNHFKSKGGDDPLYGVNDPPTRSTEAQRKLQARVVRDYVNQLLAANPNAWVLVGGDLNDFAFPEPGEGSDHPVGIVQGSGDEIRLTNLVNREHEAERFTFVFDGNSQVLDHMLVSPALKDLVAGQDILHFNTSFPAVLRSDPTTPLQVSDHDSLEARFQIKKIQPGLVLTVLHNNDGESQLINAPGQPDFGGIARFKTLVDNLRAQALQGAGKRGVIMLSSGDNFLAGPQFNASLTKGVPFYDSIGLRLVAYDAMALGNHEFDFGPDVLANFITGFDLSTHFVSANLNFTQEPNLQALVDQKVIVKSHVIKQKGELIGIVGATTPLLPAISSPRNVVVDPAVAAAIQSEVDFLQAHKVDKIIVISHLQNVNEDLALAPQLRGVDVMIAGGGDELLANPGNLLVPGDVLNPALPYPLYATGADGVKIPVVTTAGDYKYVGRLVVTFDKAGQVISVDPTSGPVRVAGGSNPDAVAANPDVQAQVVEPVQAFVNGLANNIIATSEVALEGRRGPTPPGVRTAETNLGNLMADALRWQANELAADFGVEPADVALQNGGGIRNNNLIPAGPISELNTFQIAAFSNFVSIVPDIPPAQFKEIMENAVSGIPNADGRFAQISGFTLVYDPAGTAQVVDNAGTVLTPGNRVIEIRLDDGTYIVQNGEIVPGAPSVNISTNDFSARGGDQYPFRGASFTTVGVTYQQALLNYIVNALGSLITAADYPEGGEGRITTGSVQNTLLVQPPAVEPTASAEPPGGTETPTAEPAATDTTTPEPTPTDTATPEPTATDATPPEPTPTDTATPEPTPTDTATPEPSPTGSSDTSGG
ncbi:MAG: 5'-nucleotidase C-terminal domain-containing protein [Anaerolineae bacterium]|nr:5'-nucleotidase C-terminal domain-containing protein [Anaerolineae bacterium]